MAKFIDCGIFLRKDILKLGVPQEKMRSSIRVPGFRELMDLDLYDRTEVMLPFGIIPRDISERLLSSPFAEQLLAIISEWEHTRRFEVVLIASPPRSGKTACLHGIQDLLSGREQVVYIDLMGYDDPQKVMTSLQRRVKGGEGLIVLFDEFNPRNEHHRLVVSKVKERYPSLNPLVILATPFNIDKTEDTEMRESLGPDVEIRLLKKGRFAPTEVASFLRTLILDEEVKKRAEPLISYLSEQLKLPPYLAHRALEEIIENLREGGEDVEERIILVIDEIKRELENYKLILRDYGWLNKS